MEEKQSIVSKSFLIKSFVSIVVIIIGVTAGLFIATNFGIVKWVHAKTLSPEDIKNNTTLHLGESFPKCEVFDEQNNSVDIESLIQGKKTFIGVVSNGCEACMDLMNALGNNRMVPDGFQLILLSSEPKYFYENYDYQVYRIPYEFLIKYSIDSYPTIFTTNEDGTLKIICSGYTDLLNKKFIEQL